MYVRWLTFLSVVCLSSAIARPLDLQTKHENLESTRIEITKLVSKSLSDSERAHTVGLISEALDAVQTLHEAYQEQVRQGLIAIHGTQKAVIDPEDTTFPFPADKRTPGLMRSQIMNRNGTGYSEVLVPLIKDFLVLKEWLEISHSSARLQGQKHMPYDFYRVIRIQADHLSTAFQRIFGVFPRLPWSQVDEKGQPFVPYETLDPIVNFFSPDGVTDTARQAVLTNMVQVESSYRRIVGYHAHYPGKESLEQLRHFGEYFDRAPWFGDCANLARGMSDLSSEVCQPRAFRQAMTDFIRYYKHRNTPHLLAFILNSFNDWKAHNDKPFDDQEAKRLEEELTSHLRRSGISKEKAVLDRLVAVGRDAVATVRGKPKLLSDGLALTKTLQTLLEDAGFRPMGHTDADTHGLVMGAELVLKNLDHQLRITQLPSVPYGPLSPQDEERRKETLRAARMPEQFERLDASPESCPLFTNKQTEKAPWIFTSRAITPEEPRFSTTVSGAKKIHWMRQVKAGNAVSMQDQSRVRDKTLAGLLTHQFLMWNIPTIVYTRLLLGMPVEDLTLDELGLTIGKAGGELAQVMKDYQYPDFPAQIHAASVAAHQFLLDYADTTQKELTPELWDDYRENIFRKRMLESAEQLRELHSTVAKVKETYAQKAAPPLVAIFQMDAQAAKERSDKHAAAGLNLSLVREWYPTLIDEYVRFYKYKGRPKAEQETIKKKLASTFTVDQLRDLLDWYVFPGHEEGKISNGGKWPYSAPINYPGRLSGGDVIGNDEFRLLFEQPEIMGRMLIHTQSSYEHLLEPLEYAIRLREYQNPQLRNGVWKTYKDSDFHKTMRAFLDNAVKIGNRVLDLEYQPVSQANYWAKAHREFADTTLWVTDLFWERIKDTLTFFMPIRAIQDEVMRHHPEMKLALCEEQGYRKLTDDVIDWALLGASGAGAIAAITNPVVGIPAEAALLYLDAGRTYQKWKEVARTEAVTAATVTGMDQSTSEANAFYLRELHSEFALRLGQTAISAALFAGSATTAVLANGKLLKLPGIVMGRAVHSLQLRWTKAFSRAWHFASVAEKVDPWFRALPKGWIRNTVSTMNHVKEMLFVPMQEIGLLERFSMGRVYRSIFPGINWFQAGRNVRALQNEVSAFLKASSKERAALLRAAAGRAPGLAFKGVQGGYQFGTNLSKEGLHFFASYMMQGGPLSLLFGRRLAGHGLGLLLMGYGMYHIGLEYLPQGAQWTAERVANYFVDYQLSEVQELALYSLNEHPERYEDYINAQFNGEWDHTVTLQLVELDQKLSGEYRNRVGMLVGAYRDAADEGNSDVLRNAKENLEFLIAQKEKEIQLLESSDSLDLNQLRVSSTLKRFAEQALQSL